MRLRQQLNTLAVLAVPLATLLAGCTTVVPQAKPVNPVPVYLADYGVHSSLMLPVRSDCYVEYCFGDWNYAVENHTWPQDAAGALLISFQAALGRRFFELPDGETAPHPPENPKRVMEFYASRADVDHLLAELNARFTKSISTARMNTVNNVEFVKDSAHYSWWNNCNDLTAHGLRELHCEVHGLVGTSKFHMAAPRQSPAPTTEPALASKPQPAAESRTASASAQ